MRRILAKRYPCLVIMVMAVMVGLLASGCFGPGTFRVGVDIGPGTYRNSDSSGGCYWARLSGFGGTPGEIIASNFTLSPEVVTISPTDVGFTSVACGVWTWVAPVAPAPTDTLQPPPIPPVARDQYCAELSLLLQGIEDDLSALHVAAAQWRAAPATYEPDLYLKYLTLAGGHLSNLVGELSEQYWVELEQRYEMKYGAPIRELEQTYGELYSEFLAECSGWP